MASDRRTPTGSPSATPAAARADTEAVTPFVIGVAGGSGSGKTTVTERIAEAVGPDRLSVIDVDSYYRDQSHLAMPERVTLNYDHPDIFEWDLLFDHLARLRGGEAVDVPVYDYSRHVRAAATRRVHPSHVIVIDGILVLHEERLRELMDLRIFVDVDADLRFIRRLQRDVSERGRTTDSVIQQYLTTVRPSHLQFVEPTRRHADVIIPHGGRNERALDVLRARLAELAGRSAT